MTTAVDARRLGKPFWIIWAVELWERFGYYGVQAIITLYFVQQLGYTEAESFYVFGSFSAFVYGFVWIGGWLGDQYFGAKRMMVLGAIVLAFSYAGLAMATHGTIFYALAGIVIGNTLFKANPTSLISKMYAHDHGMLDGAMTYYYMAINVGSMISMSVTPILADVYGWSVAFWVCSAGLFLGLGNYYVYRRVLTDIDTEPGLKSFSFRRLAIILIASALALVVIANLLVYSALCYRIVYGVVFFGFFIFLKVALSRQGKERTRMLVALVLITQGIVFFVLYNQMPTSLTFFALHNVNNELLGWHIPPAEYQVLNPLIIVLVSPFLVWMYRKAPATHVTKFCFGMTLCALAFLVLAIPEHFTTTGLVSPWWMVLTYVLQSTGELLISGLGLAMVVSLCPKNMSGFVVGIWFLTNMLAGPIGAWVGALTTVDASVTLTTMESLHLYSHVFCMIGTATGAVTLLMWLFRPLLNKLLA